MRISIAVTLTMLVLGGCSGQISSQVAPSSARRPASPESAGAGLREIAITTPPSKLGFTADAEYPAVYGVLVDWPLDEQVATVVAMRDGTASLYTTSTFGIIGGIDHASARAAATRLVRTAEPFVDSAEPVVAYPYPPAGTVYYYLLSYTGVRRCTGELNAVEAGSDPTYDMFMAAQDEITELRAVSEALDGGGGQ